MHFFHNAARVSALVATVALAACGQDDYKSKAAEGGAAESESGDSDAHEHDHEHGHVHADAFGGTVVELGDHFANLEFKHDSETGTFELWTMDAHNQHPVKSPTEAVAVVIGEGDDAFTVELQPEVLASVEWVVGSSAHFEATDERLVGMDSFHATVQAVSVKGEEFTEVLLHVGHEPHDDGDH